MADTIIKQIFSELTGNLSEEESRNNSENILFISKKRKLEAEMPRYGERVVYPCKL